MKTKFFLLDWKKIAIIIALAFISIILHNVVSGLFQTEEAFFFSLVIFVIPIYLVIAVLFTGVHFLKNKIGKK